MKKKLGFKIVLSLTLVAATLSPTFAKPLVNAAVDDRWPQIP